MGKKLSPVKALEIYNSIPDESTRTNVFICNSLLSSLVKNGKFESGIKLFDKMKQDGLTPDSVTYNTVLAYNTTQNYALCNFQITHFYFKTLMIVSVSSSLVAGRLHKN